MCADDFPGGAFAGELLATSPFSSMNSTPGGFPRAWQMASIIRLLSGRWRIFSNTLCGAGGSKSGAVCSKTSAIAISHLAAAVAPSRCLPEMVDSDPRTGIGGALPTIETKHFACRKTKPRHRRNYSKNNALWPRLLIACQLGWATKILITIVGFDRGHEELAIRISSAPKSTAEFSRPALITATPVCRVKIGEAPARRSTHHLLD